MKCIECGVNIGDDTPFVVCDLCWEHKERGSEMKKVEKTGVEVPHWDYMIERRVRLTCGECGKEFEGQEGDTDCEECFEAFLLSQVDYANEHPSTLHNEGGIEMNKVEKMSGIAVCLDCGTPLVASATPHRWHCPKCSADEPVAKTPPDKPECRTCPLWTAGICHHSSIMGFPCIAEWYCEHHPDYPVWSVWELARRKREVQS